jgi:glycine/D-amino acid oxidase-like deaminating enzyme
MSKNVWPAWVWHYWAEARAVRGQWPWIEEDDCEEMEPYIHRDAARAWQALRDWLDGTAEQWLPDAALARAIERAAGELPEGHAISVHVERGAGWVEATVTSEGGPDMTLAEQVNALVDAAIAAGSVR